MKKSHARIRVNGKVLAWLLLSLAATVTGVHFLHAFQVRRSAHTLLEEAVRAEEEGRLPQADDFFRLYLSYVPEDFEARVRSAMLQARLAVTTKERARVIASLESILRRAADRQDVRRRLVELAIQLGRFSDARDHLIVLCRDAPEDAALEHLSGECEEAAGAYAKAAEMYDLAIRHGPERIDSYVRLADVQHHHLGQSEQAAAVLDDMVEFNVSSFRAFLARTRYRQRLARDAQKGPEAAEALKLAASDAAEALRLAPDEPEVLLSAAELEHQCKDDAAARRHLTRLMKLRPREFRPYFALARLEGAAGRRKEAAALLRRSLKRASGPLDQWEAADLLITLDDPSAREVIVRLRKNPALTPLVRFLEARLLAREEKWLEASQGLEVARPFLGQFRELAEVARRADMLLGECYQRRGNPDQALGAFRRALQADPYWVPARLGVAGSLLALGQLEEALEEYRRLAPGQPQARLALAELLILRNLNLPPAQQSWGEAERVLREAAQVKGLENDVAILQAELLVAKDRFGFGVGLGLSLDFARALLVAERDRQPRHVPFWVALAGIHRRKGDVRGARALLEQARQQVGDVAELRLALVRLLGRSGDPKDTPALDALEQGLDRFARPDQVALLRALADAHHRLEQPAKARRLLGRLAALEPTDLNTRQALFDLALQAKDTAAMSESVAAIRAIEGPDGALWRFGEAARLIARARDGDRSGLPEARTRLVEATAKRRGWSRLTLLQAELEELERDEDAAISSYLQAIEQGDRQPVVIRRVVGLLYERKRYAEAYRVLGRLAQQEELTISGDLNRLASEVALRTRDYSRAVNLARKAVGSGGKDYLDHIWLGRVLWAAGHKEDAEAAFKRAVAEFSKEPAVWVALVQFLHQSGQPKDDVQKVIDRAAAELPAGKGALALAQCQEAVGNADEAARLYLQALTAGPDSVPVLRQVADYLMRTGRPHEATPLLRRLLDPRTKTPESERAWVRRNLAFALAIGGTEGDFAEALALVNENLRTGGVEDQRAKASVLATRPAHRREAIRLLEEASRQRRGSPAQEFLLAQLYESSQDWPHAHERFLGLIAARDAQPDHLAHYVNSLLRRKEAGEAQVWLARLERLEPQSFRTIELKARVLTARGRQAEAGSLLRGYVGKHPDARDRAAALLARLGLTKDAEAMLRESKEETPAKLLALAELLARRKEVGPALDLCERAARAGERGAAAVASVAVVRAGRGQEADCRRAERLLKEALTKGRNPVLLQALAELEDHRGRYDEAQALYREVLKQGRASPVVLNNLAWLLALSGGRAQEALELINRALETAGPVGGLLDTRAVIYLTLGRTKDALGDLQKAVAETPTPARYYHLALAQKTAGNRDAAAQAFKEARRLGLSPEALHPLEQRAYRQLLEDLGRG